MKRSDRFDRLEKALEGLSPEHREVILLSRIKGLRVKEIAERMQRSSNAVSLLLARALKKMRSSLGETESLGLPHRTLKDGLDDVGEQSRT
jgi:RNA polymerase sigma factor (sigma-70 family)